MKSRISISLNTILLLLSVILYSCGGGDANENNAVVKKQPKQQNYIVITDLSDRIIKDTLQPQIDTTLINHIYTKFLKSVKSHVYIKSNDRFCVVPIQEGNHINQSTYMENMIVDMKKILPKDRKPKENERTNNFKNTISKLYSVNGAKYSNNEDDYKGADIWKFFKDDLKDYLINDSSFSNNIIILTDGYMFVDGKQKEISEVIAGVGQDFQEYKINLMVLEIRPKYNRDNEWPELQKQWLDWLNGMGISNVRMLHTSAVNQTKTKIDEYFDNPEKYTTSKNNLSNTERNQIEKKKNKIEVKKENTSIKTIKHVTQDKVASKPQQKSNVSYSKFKNDLANESNREKRFLYFLDKIYPNLSNASNNNEVKEIVTNIKTDLSFLKSTYPEKEVRGKKYSEYYKELNSYE
jgi:hypothetical protein